MSPLSVHIDTLESYAEVRRRPTTGLCWNCLFVLPFWLQTVCRHLGAPGDTHIVTVREEGRIIAVLPLAIDDGVARFLGSHEVCDYQDMVCVPSKSVQALEAVLTHLNRQGIRELDLRTLRPEAAVLDAFKALAPSRTEAGLTPDEVTFEADLPSDWDAYLMQLSGKQRHEVRRKIRRLENHDSFGYRLAATDPTPAAAATTFVDLFRRNRSDKARFMSREMADYFGDLIRAAADEGLCRLYVLDVDEEPAASVLCFDYEGVRYLYNSGYDERFESLSVGVLSKIFSIKAGIEMGCRRYDFLKGSEIYKKRIGGNEVPLYRLRISL